MVSDGRNSLPARRVRMLRTKDIPWLKDIEAEEANSHSYVPPLPLCVLAGEVNDTSTGATTTDWAALDQMKVLAEASDPARDDVLAMRSLWRGGEEGTARRELWGVLLFTRTFACVIEKRYVLQHHSLVAQALAGILKPGYLAPVPPTIVLTDIEDGRLLSRTFDVAIGLPFVIKQAAAELAARSGDPERAASAQAAARSLSGDVAAYLRLAESDGRGGVLQGMLQGVRGVPWFKVSDEMRDVLVTYRDLDSDLRRHDMSLPQYLRAEWADAINDGGSDDASDGASEPGRAEADGGEADPARIARNPSAGGAGKRGRSGPPQ